MPSKMFPRLDVRHLDDLRRQQTIDQSRLTAGERFRESDAALRLGRASPRPLAIGSDEPPELLLAMAARMRK